jgi:hypothetical protein
MSQTIEIATKLYQARNTVIGLIGKEKFKERVDGFRPILKGMCEKKKITEMEATMEILKDLQGDGHLSVLAMAACTEIMEPSL